MDLNKKYVLAVYVQPPYANSHIVLLDPIVSNSDFTCGHQYDDLQAPYLGLRTVKMPDLHVKIVGAALYLSPECEESWNILNAVSRDTLDDYNDPSTIDTIDRGTGALASFNKMGSLLHKNFWDPFQHVCKNIDEHPKLKKADKEAYLRALDAKDEQELEECISKF